MKGQGIVEVSMIHPLGTMNVFLCIFGPQSGKNHECVHSVKQKLAEAVLTCMRQRDRLLLISTLIHAAIHFNSPFHSSIQHSTFIYQNDREQKKKRDMVNHSLSPPFFLLLLPPPPEPSHLK